VTDVVVGDDGLARCLWGYSTPEYHDYHDHEWGLPVGDDRRIFEKLCLEGFQVGLSWLTILRKREGFRRAFANFDPAVIAAFGPTEIEQLIRDPHIVRNRAKIEPPSPTPRLHCAWPNNTYPSPLCCGATNPNATPCGAPWATSQPPQLNRKGSRQSYAATASVSSAQPPSTPRCNTSESSTTTSKAAITGPSPNQPEQPSQDQGAERGG
jgi:DNA-3-methyladenine glycosylase I